MGFFYFYEHEGSVALQWSALSPHSKKLSFLFVANAFSWASAGFLPTVQKHALSLFLGVGERVLSSWWWTDVLSRVKRLFTLTKSGPDVHALHLLRHQAADLCDSFRVCQLTLFPSRKACLPTSALPFQKQTQNTFIKTLFEGLLICLTVCPSRCPRSSNSNSYSQLLTVRKAVKPAGCTSPTTNNYADNCLVNARKMY